MVAGNVTLKDYKRPRPLVLRMNVGDSAEHALGRRTRRGPPVGQQHRGRRLERRQEREQPRRARRHGDLHALRRARGQSPALLLGATTGGEGDGGSHRPMGSSARQRRAENAEWYRSQLTRPTWRSRLRRTRRHAGEDRGRQPIINYDAVYPAGHPRAGKPILKMLDANNNIVHSDLNAIITGRTRALPGGHLPRERRGARPRPAVPRVHRRLPRRDQGRAGVPEFYEDPVLGTRCTASATASPSTTARRHRRGDSRQPPRRRPDGELHRVQLRGLLPLGVGRRRPGAARRRAGQRDRRQRQPDQGREGDEGALPRRPVERHHSYINDHVKMRVLHAGAEGAPHPPPARAPVAEHARQRQLELPRQPGHRAGLLVHDRDRARRLTAIATRRRATRSSTATSTRTSRRACGNCGARTTSSRRARNSTATAVPSGARALPDGEIAAGTPIPASCRSRPSRWPRCRRPEFKGFPFYVPGRRRTPSAAPAARHRRRRRSAAPRHRRRHLHEASQPSRLQQRPRDADAKAVPETGTADEKAAMNFHAQPAHLSFRARRHGRELH
jgi:hypothetical protein